VVIQRAVAARRAPLLISVGVGSEGGRSVVRLFSVHASDLGSVTIGVAADLDEGKVYFRQDGSWNGVEPGSSKSVVLEGGELRTVVVRTSGVTGQLVEEGAIVINGGSRSFQFRPPEGYKPWK
jgi:hypothetical protein